MQELFSKLLWDNPDLCQKAERLRETLPGFQEAQREYNALAEQVQAAAGYDLYDRYFTQLMRYSDFEVRAYYALGLGLRGALARELGLHSPK